MKKITYLILILVIISCQKEDKDGVPAYIKIDNITVIDTTIFSSTTDSSIYKNVTDAWVSINGISKGVYELPANFPVLNNGNVEVRIYAGIKDNGIAATRTRYAFYNSYLKNTTLSPDSITTINPIVTVKENISGRFDDFDPVYSFSYDSCCFQQLSNGPYEDYGSLILSDSELVAEISYKDHPLNFGEVPQQGSPTYFELDYKSNTRFLVGMYINYPNLNSTVEKGLLWINPKDDWNKIYINLTETVTESVGADNFSVFIRMERNDDLIENKLDFDNIRVIHYNN